MPKQQWWKWRKKKEKNSHRKEQNYSESTTYDEDQLRRNKKKRRIQFSSHKRQQEAEERLLPGNSQCDERERGPNHYTGERSNSNGQKETIFGFHKTESSLITEGLKESESKSKKQIVMAQNCSQSYPHTKGKKSTMQEPSSVHKDSRNSSQSTSKIGRHIPGFYFDPVKKQYFRSLPGSNNPYSMEAIAKKKAEQKRITLLNSECNNPKNNVPNKLSCPSINQIIYQRQRGNCSSTFFERHLQETCVSRMSSKSMKKLTACNFSISNDNFRYMNRLEADRNAERILTVVSDDCFHRFCQGSIEAQNHNLGIDVKRWHVIKCIGARYSKVTSASWVSIDHHQDDHILYTVSGGQSSEIQLFEQNPDSLHIVYNNSTYGMVWTSCWSKNKMLPNHLSVGGRKSYVVDIVTSNKTYLNTNGSEVFSQVFAKSQPLLYNGTKRGEVFSFDFRTPCQSRRKFASILNHTTSVCCLHLLNDENYLLASDVSGKIKMWDIRMCAVAKEYYGNNNQYRQLPFKVDSTESILYTVGQDCFTRLWGVKTGTLLKTIPPPLSASKQTMPSVIYSTDWSGNSGLLLATLMELHWYPVSLY